MSGVRWYTPAEASAILKRPVKTLYRDIALGTIPPAVVLRLGSSIRLRAEFVEEGLRPAPKKKGA